MIPIDLYNWHMWLRSEGRAIKGMREETPKNDMIRRVFLDGYKAHHKCTCRYFATQVRALRKLDVGRN